jgi:hypothetical protein
MENFRTQWKQEALKKSYTGMDMAVLAFVKATRKENFTEAAKFYLRRQFKPVSNEKKLRHGHAPDFKMWQALSFLSQCQSFKWLSEEQQTLFKGTAKVFVGSVFGYKVNV